MYGVPSNPVCHYPSVSKQLELNSFDTEDVTSVTLGNGLRTEC
jgi:hypothetical protein